MRFLLFLFLLPFLAHSAPIDFDDFMEQAVEGTAPAAAVGNEAPKAALDTPVATVPEKDVFHTEAKDGIETPEKTPETTGDIGVAQVAAEALEAANKDVSSSSSSESDETEKETPSDAEEAVEQVAVLSDTAPTAEPEVEEQPVDPAVAGAEEKQAVEETAPVAATEAPQPEPAFAPVLTNITRTGSTARVDGVTIRFALQATWAVEGVRYRGYMMKVTNGSHKDVCGVIFLPNTKTTNVWNLSIGDDGAFTTKDLHLVPGATGKNFGYISSERSRPTILGVKFC